MGTSRPTYLQEYGNFIIKLKPKSILDIGIGFGKNGYLAREYTDIWQSRILPKEWVINIDGIEIFDTYIHDATRFIYNNIFLGNVLSHMELFKNYDLIVMTDVLEHFIKSDALLLMNNISKANHFFITTPINPSNQKEVNKNKYEEHLCKFSHKELSQYGCNVINKKDHNILIAYK